MRFTADELWTVLGNYAYEIDDIFFDEDDAILHEISMNDSWRQTTEDPLDRIGEKRYRYMRLDEAFSKIKDEAVEEAEHEAQDRGYQSGYEDGYDEASTEGKSRSAEAFDDGHEQGRKEGYDEGYEKGYDDRDTQRS